MQTGLIMILLSSFPPLCLVCQGYTKIRTNVVTAGLAAKKAKDVLADAWFLVVR